jgi:hypothetical protein
VHGKDDEVGRRLASLQAVALGLATQAEISEGLKIFSRPPKTTR